MAEDFYNDSPNPAPSSDSAVEAKEDEAGDSNVAMLNKSFFPAGKDLKPGSVCKIRVEEDHGDQLLVAYVHDEEPVEEAPEVAAPPMDSEMAGFMS